MTVGTVGMFKEAIAVGTTKLGDVSIYGNKYTLRILASNILLFILEFVSVIFWLPLYFAYKNTGLTIDAVFDALLNNPDGFLSLLSLLIIPIVIGLLLTIVYTIILSFVFYFVSYAIVIDDLSVIAAYKKSYTLLKEHPGHVIAFILIICDHCRRHDHD